MALSLAQRTQQRKRAATAAAAASGPALTMEGATAYELQLAQLQQDRLRLKQIQSGEGKAELKRTLLPNYAPYVDGVLSAGKGAHDEVLTTLMVWRIDAGDYAGALQVARYVLQHKLPLPDKFERTPGTLIAEEIAEAALKAQKAGGTFDLLTLVEVGNLTKDEDMPDQARAKLYLAVGRAFLPGINKEAPTPEDLSNLEAARNNLARAIELHSTCGGKKDLEGVERLLKKHAVPPAS
ncbi:phage terminase small subunit [Pseudomonas sp. Marseille-Q8238]